MTKPYSNQAIGLSLALIGVLALIPDTLFVRLTGADVWTMAFWRGLLMGLTLLAVTVCFYRKRSLQVFRQGGKVALAVAVLFAAEALFFILSLTHTAVANTLVILAAAPMFAALYSIVLLRERAHWITWVAMGVVFVGIALPMRGDLGHNGVGLFFALLSAMIMGLVFSLVRWKPEVNMVPSIGLGAVLMAFVALPFAHPFDLSQDQAIWLVAQGVVSQSLPFAMFALASRHIPSAEVILVGRLETVTAPFLVWLVVGEQPPAGALIGMIMVVAALVVHSWWSLRSESGPKPSDVLQ